MSAESEKWMQDNGIISGLKDKFQSCWDAATLNVVEKLTAHDIDYTWFLHGDFGIIIYTGNDVKKFAKKISNDTRGQVDVYRSDYEYTIKD